MWVPLEAKELHKTNYQHVKKKIINFIFIIIEASEDWCYLSHGLGDAEDITFFNRVIYAWYSAV